MVKSIFEINHQPCLGAVKSGKMTYDNSDYLEQKAKDMFGRDWTLLFSKSRKIPLPQMKKKFIRKVYHPNRVTFQAIGDYLGLNHTTVMHHYYSD